MRSAAQILDCYFAKRHLQHKLEQYAAFPQWPEVVGAELAKVTRPQKISNSRLLVILVPDSTWAQELSLRKNELLDLIRKANFGKSIDDLRFVVGSPQDFS